MNIKTTRFGDVAIDETRTLHFPEGLLGFPEQKDYVLLEHKSDSPFFWLQSVDRPDLAFILTNPFLLDKDYLKNLSPNEEILFQCREGDSVSVFVLVTIPPGKVEEMTVNLLGPVVVEAEARVGRQVVIPNSGYSHRHPLPQK